MNTARGGLVDEAALAMALKDNRIRAAAVGKFKNLKSPKIPTILNIILITYSLVPNKPHTCPIFQMCTKTSPTISFPVHLL